MTKFLSAMAQAFPLQRGGALVLVPGHLSCGALVHICTSSDGRNKAMIIAESLARVFAVIEASTVGGHIVPLKHNNVPS